MAKTLRVHNIAKELGVTSKDIVKKCEAEEIADITNHMSTVSAGLAATIREWFSESGGVVTAVEVAAPVDVVKARARAKRKVVSKSIDTGGDEGGTATAVAEPEEVAKATPSRVTAPSRPATAARAKAAPSKAKAPEKAETPEATAEIAAAAPAPAEPQVTAPVETAAPADVDSSQTADQAKVVMNVPERPQNVAPVGPMLEQPTKTKLAGPRVIRVEAPDILPAPRPKRDVRAGDGPMARGGIRGGRGPGGPAESDDEAGRGGDAKSSRRNKRRTTPTTEGRRSARGGTTETPSSNWRKQDLLERAERLNRSGGFFRTHRRDNLKRSGAGGGQRALSPKEAGGKVTIEEPISIKELSLAAGVKAADILKKLFLGGVMANLNSVIETEKAIEVMLEFGIELDVVAKKSAEEEISEQFDARDMLEERARPPVVTILGHVDHGKTSLLDRIRNANVAEGEAGGITQATSAFRVPVKAGESERVIVFLDTPGHEAFTEMRARGAKVTDIVVLVVAADDGVMPQTVESINHAKAAGVPIIVALNKIDKPEATDANIQRILGQLAEHELNPVEWGGTTEVIRTSAVKGTGIQDLLDILDYQAELHDYKADFAGPALGTVIEAKMEEGRGPVAHVLVQQGELKKGDFIVIGRGFGRVRDIVDDHGERVESASPSTPVAISGIDVVPDAGDKFYIVKTLKEAEGAADERRRVERERELAQPKVTLDNIFEKLKEGGRKELRLIVKGDVQGSVETLRKSLSEVEVGEDVVVSVLHSAVGGINESDITLAEASGAIVIGFNVTSSAKARQVADQKRIDIRLYDVIYDILNDVEKAAKGLLAPVHRLEVLGHAEVRQVFRISKVGMIAGCYVTDGVIERNAQIRVTRQDIVVEKDRRLEQLKRFKDDAKEVRAGQECGMKIDGYDDIKEGDILECYKSIQVTND